MKNKLILIGLGVMAPSLVIGLGVMAPSLVCAGDDDQSITGKIKKIEEESEVRLEEAKKECDANIRDVEKRIENKNMVGRVLRGLLNKQIDVLRRYYDQFKGFQAVELPMLDETVEFLANSSRIMKHAQGIQWNIVKNEKLASEKLPQEAAKSLNKCHQLTWEISQKLEHCIFNLSQLKPEIEKFETQLNEQKSEILASAAEQVARLIIK